MRERYLAIIRSLRDFNVQSLESRKVLYGILLFGLIHSLIYWHSVIMTDGTAYATIAEGLAYEFRLFEGDLVYTPGYPILTVPFIWLTGNAELSGQLVSLLATLGSLILVWYLGNRFIGPAVGSLASVFLVTAVFFMRKSFWVMSEPTYSFLMLGSALLAIACWRNCTYGKSAALGIALSLLHLTRPEGLFAITAILAGLAITGVIVGGRLTKLTRAAIIAASIFVASYFTYALTVHELTGEWSVSTKLQNNWYVANSAALAKEHGIPHAYEWMQRGLDETGTVIGTSRFEKPDILKLVLDNPSEFAGRFFDNIAKEFLVLLKAMNLLLLLSAVGIVCSLRTKETRGASLILLAFLLPLGVYPIFYIQDRNIETMIPIFCIFAAVGTLSMAHWYQDRRKSIGGDDPNTWQVTATTIVFAIVLAGPPIAVVAKKAWDLYSYAPYTRFVHRDAGLWLREHSDKDALVMARKPWVSFYARRKGTSLPYATAEQVFDRARKMGVDFLVVDAAYTSYQLQPLLDDANAPSFLKAVYSKKLRGNELVIYQLDPS